MKRPRMLQLMFIPPACRCVLETPSGISPLQFWVLASVWTPGWAHPGGQSSPRPIAPWILRFQTAPNMMPSFKHHCCPRGREGGQPFLHFEMMFHVFTLDSTPACREFLWGSQRTWPTVTLRLAASWRTVMLIMTIFGMTTHRGLYSQQVRLIRQAVLTDLTTHVKN